MANYFCQHDPQPGDVAYGGADDGSSWEDAFQDLSTAANGLSDGDTLYVKEHAGIDASGVAAGYMRVTSAGDRSFLAGCDSDLTGTSTGPRTGMTIMDGNSVNGRALVLNGAATGTSIFSRFDMNAFRMTANPYEGGAIYSVASSSTVLQLEDCVVRSSYCGTFNILGHGGGGYFDQGTCKLIRCSFHNNNSNAGESGGGAYFYRCSLEMEDCIWYSNSARGGGGAFAQDNAGVSTYTKIERCKFYSNSTVPGSNFAAIVAIVTSGSGSYIRNSLISENHSGGTRAMNLSNIAMVNCTIVDNTMSGTGVGGAQGTGYNCIAWGNDGDQVSGTFTYSDIEGGYTGTGNVDADPQFLGSGDDPYDLSGSTPVSVSNGGNTGVPDYIAEDLLERVRSATPSMGAYESQGAGPVTPEYGLINLGGIF